MDFNSLTTTLTNFINAFNGGYSLLLPSVRWLTGTLLAIELSLIGIYWAVSGGERLIAVIKKLLFILFWVMLVGYFDVWAKTFVKSLINAGLIAGGQSGNYNLLLDPSRIAGYGLDATMPLVDKLQGISFDVVDAIIVGFAYMLIMLAFLVIAIQVVLCQLEYYLVLVLASILLPWGLLKPTKFIAEKAIGAIISAGVKLMVLSFIIAVADNVLSNIQFASNTIEFNELWAVFLTTGTIAFLAWSAPGMAAGLVSGSPSLTAGTAAQNMAATTVAGAAATQAIVSATRAAARGGSTVGALGAQTVGAYQMGSSMASTFDGAGKGGAAIAGMKTASNSLIRSCLGPSFNSVSGAANRNMNIGMRTGYSASGGTLSPGMKNAQSKDIATGTGKGRSAENWSHIAGKMMHATPHEARPSGGSSGPKL
ncbi:MAG: P-type conjugative transfer protein TrbL [Desulfobulbaceae bacterium]|nr:P-type conjugative transfer protein TrbL [Desulfobulbaceae bacterium]